MRNATYVAFVPAFLVGLLAVQLGQTAPAALAQQDAGAAPAAAAAGSCRPLAVVDAPSRLNSGAWRDGKLLLVDMPNRRLVQLSFDGTARLKPIAAGINGALGSFQPTRIRAQGDGSPSADGYVVEMADGMSFMALDKRLRLRQKALLRSPAAAPARGEEVSMLWDWVLAEGDVVGYADIAVRTGDRGENVAWKTGFVRFPVANPAAVKVVLERPYPDRMRTFFRLTYPLIASLGSRAYAFLIDEKMELFELANRRPRPLSLPRHLANELPPLLPELMSADNFPWIMDTVEQSSMPAGLYGWEGHLFVLSRSFSGGKTSWFMSKIDPERNRLLWTVRVPSSASHFTVIPGPDRWAFLEKGPVTPDGDQETTAVRFVDATRMKSSSLSRLCR